MTYMLENVLGFTPGSTAIEGMEFKEKETRNTKRLTQTRSLFRENLQLIGVY